MCSRVRTYAIRKLNVVDVELSYESGCDIIKMINWLQTPDAQRTVGNIDFLLISLGTNDVGRYGVDVSLQRCSDLIRFIRRSYPGIQTIGWLALSPRWKPTRFVSAAEIGGLHRQFNERLQVLSKQLDFDVVDARLGPADMRVEDGLHPSTTTGRWKYEGALREWFSSRAVAHSCSSFFFQRHYIPSTLHNYNDRFMQHHYQRYNNRQVASSKDQAFSKEGDDILLIDTEEIPIARPSRKNYTNILNLTLSENESESNPNSSISNSDTDEKAKKK
ncbi:unnamed protein product, partial [Rotaria sp. Silwood2]